MESVQVNNETNQLGDEGRRAVLLIKTPVGDSFETTARAVGCELPPCSPIDCKSFENSALPDLKSRQKFVTHYALCIIDSDDWDDNDLSLLEKFKSARLWDHPDDSTMLAASQSSTSTSNVKAPFSDAGVHWDDGNIVLIESGEETGRTDMPDDEITQGLLRVGQGRDVQS